MVEELLVDVAEDGFTVYCCGPKSAPNALVAAYEWEHCVDLLTIRDFDRVTTARVPRHRSMDIFAPQVVVWAYEGPPQQALRALLDLVHPAHPDAPTAAFPAPARLHVPRTQQRPMTIRLPAPGRPGVRTARLATAITTSDGDRARHGAAIRPGMAQRPLVGAVGGVARSTTSSPSGVVPVEQYVAGLSRKRMAAGVLFRDVQGRVLLVEPSYKPNWEIPGGAVEADESPWAAATRELIEELSSDRPLGRLLVVDYVRPQDSRPEGVVFVFDGGVLEKTDVVGMVLADGEILSAGFHTLVEARGKVKPLLADRLGVALEAVGQGATVLCEQGRRIG